MRGCFFLLPLPILVACGGRIEGQARDAGSPSDDAAVPTPADASAPSPEAGPPPPPPKPAQTIIDSIQPTDFALDATSVYWTNFAPHRVAKADRNGGPMVQLAVGAPNSELRGIAVSGPDLFWTQTSPVPNTGMIFRSNLDGSGAVAIATGQRYPTGIAVDATHVFWVNSWGSGGGNVMRADRDGSNAKVIATVPTLAYWVTAGGGWVCWCNQGAWCSDVDGSKLTVLSKKDVWSVAIDGDTAYYVESPDGVLRRTPLGGGPTEDVTVVSPQYSSPVAVDATHVYFSAAGWPGIERSAKTPNATPELLTAELPLHYVYEMTSKFILDDTYYYYFGVTGGTNTSIKRRPK